MDTFTLLIAVGIIYGVLFFFDSFFKSCMHYPYQAFLEGTGLTVNFLRLNWYTTALNRTIVKWGSSKPRIFTKSFDFGVYTSIILMPVSLSLLIYSIFATKSSNGSLEEGKSPYVEVEILLPGVTLPLDEIVYYIIALVVCSVIHELGHAIAAVLEDVPLLGLGIRIFFILPVAYTELGSEQMVSLRPWRKLRFLCAGLWHNIILAFFGYLIFSALPYILSPFYSTDSGVIVTNVAQNSPIYGNKGLARFDVIFEINNCPVRNMFSLHVCLIKSLKQQPAYCVTSDFVHKNDESIHIEHTNGVVECCDKNNMKNICFEYLTDADVNGMLELPQYMCLNIRKTIEHLTNYCITDKCNSAEYCIKPIMNNVTTIIHIKRQSKNDVIFMGHPGDIYKSVEFSNYVPKIKILPPHIADKLNLILKYIIVFSFGLAIVNVVPCYGFDGQHIINVILHQMLGKLLPNKQSRDLIVLLVTVLGTALQFIVLFKFVWSSLVTVFY